MLAPFASSRLCVSFFVWSRRVVFQAATGQAVDRRAKVSILLIFRKTTLWENRRTGSRIKS